MSLEEEEREDKMDEGKNRRELIQAVSSKPDVPHQIQDKPVLNFARSQSKDETKRVQKERIRLPKFQWTE